MDLKTLHRHFNISLEQIISQDMDLLSTANHCLELCAQFLDFLKIQILENGFKNNREEIQFFKSIKQAPLSNYLYYKSLKLFLTEKPRALKKSKIKFVEKKLKNLNHFFQSNIDFCQYIDCNQHYLDSYYFIRIKMNTPQSIQYHNLLEPSFHSPKDSLLAQYTANKKLVYFYEERLERIKNDEVLGSNTHYNADILSWSSSKTDLVELIYALYHSKVINGGKTDIISISRIFEKVFNIELGEIYKTYSEIKERKKNRTKFLDEISHDLQREILRSES